MNNILLLAYLVVGYWAVGQTVYANKIRIGSWDKLFLRRFIIALFLGFILIPVALLKCFFMKK